MRVGQFCGVFFGLHEIEEAISHVNRANGDFDNARVWRLLVPGKHLDGLDGHCRVDFVEPLHDLGAFANKCEAVIALVHGELHLLELWRLADAESAEMSVSVLA